MQFVRLTVKIQDSEFPSQYYGFEASLLPFCDLLETQNFTSAPLEGGLVSSISVNETLNAFLAAIVQLDYDSIPGDADDPVSDRSWMRQYCSEYGVYCIFKTEIFFVL